MSYYIYEVIFMSKYKDMYGTLVKFRERIYDDFDGMMDRVNIEEWTKMDTVIQECLTDMYLCELTIDDRRQILDIIALGSYLMGFVNGTLHETCGCAMNNILEQGIGEL